MLDVQGQYLLQQLLVLHLSLSSTLKTNYRTVSAFYSSYYCIRCLPFDPHLLSKLKVVFASIKRKAMTVRLINLQGCIYTC